MHSPRMLKVEERRTWDFRQQILCVVDTQRYKLDRICGWEIQNSISNNTQFLVLRYFACHRIQAPFSQGFYCIFADQLDMSSWGIRRNLDLSLPVASIEDLLIGFCSTGVQGKWPYSGEMLWSIYRYHWDSPAPCMLLMQPKPFDEWQIVCPIWRGYLICSICKISHAQECSRMCRRVWQKARWGPPLV